MFIYIYIVDDMTELLVYYIYLVYMYMYMYFF